MVKELFFTGLANMKKAARASGGELKLENNEKVLIKFLDDYEGEYPMAQYYSHYDEDIGGFPCVEDIYGRCPLCEKGLKRRYQILANVVVIEPTGHTVQYIRKGAEFVNDCLVPFIEEYGTITDRYYRITGKAQSRGPFNWVSFDMVPVDLPKDCTPPDEEKLRRVDWKTFLIVPKLEAVEEAASQLEVEDS